MGSHVLLPPDKSHKHVTVRLLLNFCCQLIGRRRCFLHSALSHLLLCLTTIRVVCECETCNAACCSLLLLEACVVDQPRNAEKTHLHVDVACMCVYSEAMWYCRSSRAPTHRSLLQTQPVQRLRWPRQWLQTQTWRQKGRWLPWCAVSRTRTNASCVVHSL